VPRAAESESESIGVNYLERSRSRSRTYFNLVDSDCAFKLCSWATGSAERQESGRKKSRGRREKSEPKYSHEPKPEAQKNIDYANPEAYLHFSKNPLLGGRNFPH